jgi:hypothetical protein
MALLVERRLEETTVEIRDAAETARGEGALVERRVEAAEEERQQDAGEELAPASSLVREAVDEEAPLAVEPAFLLHERQEQQPREDQQRLRGRVVPLARKRRRDVVHGIAKTVEELARDALTVEGAVVDARQRRLVLAVREEIQAIDRMRTRRLEVDVQPAQRAIAREVEDGECIRLLINEC